MNSYLSAVVRWCKSRAGFLLALLLVVVAANWFLYQFYRQEQYVYFWDWSAYHNHFIYMVSRLQQGLPTAIGALLYSMAFTQYGLIAPFILAPVGLLFGISRGVYLFSILNVFALPSSLLVGWALVKLSGASGKAKQGLLLAPLVIFLLSPQFWGPILLGFFDVVVVAGIAGVWVLLASDQEHRPWLKAVGVGLLLAALMLTRRWLGYWSFSFVPAVALLWVYQKVRQQKTFWSWQQIIIVGVTAAVCLILLAAPVLRQTLTDDYSSLFQAFKGGDSTWQVILGGAYYYGWLSLAFAVAGLVLALRQNGKVKAFVQVVGLQTLLTLLLFARVQRIDRHHHYQFLASIVLFQSLFVVYLWRNKWPQLVKVGLSLCLAAILLINFWHNLERPLPVRADAAHFFAGSRHAPLYRSDTIELARLLAYLDTVMPAGAQLYVDASSLVLNDDVIRNSCRYLNLDHVRVCRQILPTSNVDLRDGLPRQFPQADFVLVALPAQTHLRPQDQLVITVLQEQLLDSQALGAAYEILPETFNLDNGVKVKVLRRRRDLTEAEWTGLSTQLLRFYPDHPDLFGTVPAVPGEARTRSWSGWLGQVVGGHGLKSYLRDKLGGSDTSGYTVY